MQITISYQNIVVTGLIASMSFRIVQGLIGATHCRHGWLKRINPRKPYTDSHLSDLRKMVLFNIGTELIENSMRLTEATRVH